MSFTPFHHRAAHTDAGLIAPRTGRRFGHHDGRVRDHDGEITVEHLRGRAEDIPVRRCLPRPERRG
ncbi:DUF2804 domain-containing protein [Streptomyces sp.]|uniref:DUF2804 family protein n=1 Tax=Streptomyces sp. TaxID=1931 RepID=UPI0039C9C3F7